MGKMRLHPSQPSQKSDGSGLSSKVPCDADLADAASIGSTKSEVKKENRIHIYEVIYCDDGSVYGDMFEGEMIALHLGHEYPNVFFFSFVLCNHIVPSGDLKRKTFQKHCRS